MARLITKRGVGGRRQLFLRAARPKRVTGPNLFASDGFGGAFGTTDGLGHASGPSGGDGKAWVDVSGSFSTSSGRASADALDDSLGIQMITLPSADFTCEIDLYRTSGACGIEFRRADGSNYARIRRYNSSFQFRQRVNGSGSTLFNVTPADTSGGTLKVVVSGADVTVYHKDQLLGSVTLDASLTTANVGLYTDSTANEFDNFVVYEAA